MGLIKGTGVRGICDYIIRQRGESGLAAILRSMEDSDRELFSKPILPVTWIDHHAYLRFLIAADRYLGNGDMAYLRSINEYMAQRDLQGIYKFFIMLTSPKFICKNIPRLWRTYFKQGDARVTLLTDHEMHCDILDYDDIPEHHEHDLIPYFEEALRISGAKNPKGIHPKCVRRNNIKCSFIFTWD